MPKTTQTKQSKKKKETQGVEIFNAFTGEVIEDIGSAKRNIKQLQEAKKLAISQYDGNIDDIKNKTGLKDEELITQKKFFYKMYKIGWDTISNLSLPTYKVLKFFELNAHYKDNAITINGKYLKYDEMSKLCNIGTRQFKIAISELKNLNIICVNRKREKSVIYLNPMYMEDSKTERGIYTMFDFKNVESTY